MSLLSNFLLYVLPSNRNPVDASASQLVLSTVVLVVLFYNIELKRFSLAQTGPNGPKIKKLYYGPGRKNELWAGPGRKI